MAGAQETLQRLVQELAAIEEIHFRIGSAVDLATDVKRRMAVTLSGIQDPVVLRTLDNIIQRLQHVAPAIQQARTEVEETRLRIIKSGGH